METMQNNLSNKDTKLTAEYFFLTIGMFVSLIVLVTNFISLFFSTIEKAMPDALNAVYTYSYNTVDYNSIRTSLAILIIFAPIAFTLFYFWKKRNKLELSKYNEIIHKWTVYLIYFFTITAAAITLAVLVRYFIAGEITSRFIIKTIMVIASNGIVFFYFFRMQNANENWKSQKFMPYVYTYSIPLIILLLIVYSFCIIGSPASQRAMRLDQRRTEDLQNIQNQITNYYQQKQKLPAKIEDVINPLDSWQVIPKDPEFEKGLVYEYKMTGKLSFNICATFSKESNEGLVENSSSGSIMSMKDIAVSSMPYYGGVNANWSHPSGKYCFIRTIDKDLYPPFNPVPVGITAEPAIIQ